MLMNLMVVPYNSAEEIAARKTCKTAWLSVMWLIILHHEGPFFTKFLSGFELYKIQVQMSQPSRDYNTSCYRPAT